MPISDIPGQLSSFYRQLLAKVQGNPDEANLPFRYAENRRTRTPMIYKQDVDPNREIISDPKRFQQRRAPMVGEMEASMGEDPLAIEMGIDPIPQLKVGGLFNPMGNPEMVLRDARAGVPQGPGTTQAYDQMEELLNRGNPLRQPKRIRSQGVGAIEIGAPTAETANPNVVRHEEGHAASLPFLPEALRDFGRRFGLSPEAGSEALAYQYQGTDDPTGYTPLVNPLLEGLSVHPQLKKPIDRYNRYRRK